MSSYNEGGNSIGFDDEEYYVRTDEGHVEKKPQYSIGCERRLVVEACMVLRKRDIEFELEKGTYGNQDKCDIYIPETDLAIECKRDEQSKRVSRGIEQCKNYRSNGYNVALLVPNRHPQREGSVSEEKIVENDIPYLEFNPETREFNLIDSCGYLYPLLLSSL